LFRTLSGDALAIVRLFFKKTCVDRRQQRFFRSCTKVFPDMGRECSAVCMSPEESSGDKRPIF
jgi:hypothetical protein